MRGKARELKRTDEIIKGIVRLQAKWKCKLIERGFFWGYHECGLVSIMG